MCHTRKNKNKKNKDERCRVKHGLMSLEGEQLAITNNVVFAILNTYSSIIITLKYIMLLHYEITFECTEL